jgi:hypothetical protein
MVPSTKLLDAADGTPVDVYDRLGILEPAPDPGKLSFEAA